MRSMGTASFERLKMASARSSVPGRAQGKRGSATASKASTISHFAGLRRIRLLAAMQKGVGTATSRSL
jgi:hypothetical protein